MLVLERDGKNVIGAESGIEAAMSGRVFWMSFWQRQKKQWQRASERARAKSKNKRQRGVGGGAGKNRRRVSGTRGEIAMATGRRVVASLGCLFSWHFSPSFSSFFYAKAVERATRTENMCAPSRIQTRGRVSAAERNARHLEGQSHAATLGGAVKQRIADS